MLSAKVLHRLHIGKLADYYEGGADDYYTKDGHAIEWTGNGALALGLTGEVDREKLRQLLAGETVPGQTTRRFQRTDTKSRIGIDLTFSAPKSVSMQALIAGDPAIIAAHDLAVERALDAAEQLAQSRQKVAGRTRVETTGNLIVAKFRHETSRARDPQLHTHAVVMNLTQRKDGEWRALRNDLILKNIKRLTSIYRSELARELDRAGYTLRHEAGGAFELAHISRDQVETFSQRSGQIEAYLAARGLDRTTADTTEKARAALNTRAAKRVTERDAVYDVWQQQARELKIDFTSRAWAGVSGLEAGPRSTPHPDKTQQHASAAIDYAIRHITERQAIVEEADLIHLALEHSYGTVVLSDVQHEIATRISDGRLITEPPLYAPAEGRAELRASLVEPRTRSAWIAALSKQMGKAAARQYVDRAIAEGGLVKTTVRYTTQAALDNERTIQRIERDARATVTPIMAPDKIAQRLAAGSLSAGQKAAVAEILSTENRVIGIQGKAGTGKSTLLKTVVPMIENAGYTVRTVASYGSQVKDLRDNGLTANTLASFLKARTKDIDDKTVLILDEAGVVPTRLMERLMKVAEQAGSRLVLLGDTGQTKAIEAGRPFDQLQHAGMRTVIVDEIHRQTNEALKRGVELAAAKQAGAALPHLQAVHEIKEAGARWTTLGADFARLSRQDREDTLVVTGTNDARRAVNRVIREELGLAGEGRSFTTLHRVDTTLAQRQFSSNYQPGMVIQPEKTTSHLERHKLYIVLDTGPGNRLTVESDTGERIRFSPRNYKALSVYEAEKTEMSIGDRVRITRNDAARDLATGDRFTVVAVSPESVTLRDDRRTITLSSHEPLHLDYAHTSTVHAAQGLTARRVMIDASAYSRTTASDVFYVGISRAREDARVYTDDTKKLSEALGRETTKHAALDIKRDPVAARLYAQQIKGVHRSTRSSDGRSTPEQSKQAELAQQQRQQQQRSKQNAGRAAGAGR